MTIESVFAQSRGHLVSRVVEQKRICFESHRKLKVEYILIGSINDVKVSMKAKAEK